MITTELLVHRLPEIPPDTAETNSLLNIKDNPQFDKLVKGNYLNAVTKLALELESKVWRIEDDLKGSIKYLKS